MFNMQNNPNQNQPINNPMFTNNFNPNQNFGVNNNMGTPNNFGNQNFMMGGQNPMMNNQNPMVGNQNPMVTSPNPMVSGPLVQNQEQAVQQFHLQQMKQILNNTYRVLIYQKQFRQSQKADVQIAIQQIMRNQRNILDEIEQCVKIQSGVNQLEEKFLKQIKGKCLRLKSNNEIIMMEMFNIKEKVSRLASITVDRSVQHEQQYQIVHEKIRRVKLQIANKLNQLRNRRLLDQTMNKKKTVNRNRFVPINVALVQLKDVTQVLSMQLIKQRQQINALVKELYP